jgi:3-oxoacyl-[acyl-carrier protein] reductase
MSSETGRTKVAAVTGAAGGLGRATVAMLLADGWDVAALDLDPDGVPDLEGATGRLMRRRLDVTDAADVAAAIDEVVATLGDLDALVTIAGTNRLALLEDTTEELWDLLLDLNLKGTFLTCRAAVPSLRRRGGGRIVTMSSIFGIRGQERQVAYSASKAGVVGLTRALARELAPDDITVNALAPVMTLTPRVAGLPEDFKAQQLSRVPMGRYGTVDDVVGTIRFLLSDAGAFYTGQTFSANGGDTMP